MRFIRRRGSTASSFAMTDGMDFVLVVLCCFFNFPVVRCRATASPPQTQPTPAPRRPIYSPLLATPPPLPPRGESAGFPAAVDVGPIPSTERERGALRRRERERIRSRRTRRRSSPGRNYNYNDEDGSNDYNDGGDEERHGHSENARENKEYDDDSAGASTKFGEEESEEEVLGRDAGKPLFLSAAPQPSPSRTQTRTRPRPQLRRNTLEPISDSDGGLSAAPRTDRRERSGGGPRQGIPRALLQARAGEGGEGEKGDSEAIILPASLAEKGERGKKKKRGGIFEGRSKDRSRPRNDLFKRRRGRDGDISVDAASADTALEGYAAAVAARYNVFVASVRNGAGDSGAAPGMMPGTGKGMAAASSYFGGRGGVGDRGGQMESFQFEHPRWHDNGGGDNEEVAVAAAPTRDNVFAVGEDVISAYVSSPQKQASPGENVFFTANTRKGDNMVPVGAARESIFSLDISSPEVEAMREDSNVILSDAGKVDNIIYHPSKKGGKLPKKAAVGKGGDDGPSVQYGGDCSNRSCCQSYSDFRWSRREKRCVAKGRCQTSSCCRRRGGDKEECCAGLEPRGGRAWDMNATRGRGECKCATPECCDIKGTRLKREKCHCKRVGGGEWRGNGKKGRCIGATEPAPRPTVAPVGDRHTCRRSGCCNRLTLTQIGGRNAVEMASKDKKLMMTKVQCCSSLRTPAVRVECCARITDTPRSGGRRQCCRSVGLGQRDREECVRITIGGGGALPTPVPTPRLGGPGESGSISAQPSRIPSRSPIGEVCPGPTSRRYTEETCPRPSSTYIRMTFFAQYSQVDDPCMTELCARIKGRHDTNDGRNDAAAIYARQKINEEFVGLNCVDLQLKALCGIDATNATSFQRAGRRRTRPKQGGTQRVGDKTLGRYKSTRSRYIRRALQEAPSLLQASNTTKGAVETLAEFFLGYAIACSSNNCNEERSDLAVLYSNITEKLLLGGIESGSPGETFQAEAPELTVYPIPTGEPSATRPDRSEVPVSDGNEIPSESPSVSGAPSGAEDSRLPSISVSTNPSDGPSILTSQGPSSRLTVIPSELPTIITNSIGSRVPSSSMSTSSLVSGIPSHFPSSSTVPSEMAS